MKIASPDKSYVIRWKSVMSGGSGIGTKLFEKEEAERVAAELNTDYPEIQHEAITPPPPVVEPAKPDPPIGSER